MSDNYADAPKSIGELRADKEGDMSKWTPRDVLVSLLRDIDSGVVDPFELVVCFRYKRDGNGFSDHLKSGTSAVALVGLLDMVKTKITLDVMGVDNGA